MHANSAPLKPSHGFNLESTKLFLETRELNTVYHDYNRQMVAPVTVIYPTQENANETEEA